MQHKGARGQIAALLQALVCVLACVACISAAMCDSQKRPIRAQKWGGKKKINHLVLSLIKCSPKLSINENLSACTKLSK